MLTRGRMGMLVLCSFSSFFSIGVNISFGLIIVFFVYDYIALF
jgi:hypothetical protein